MKIMVNGKEFNAAARVSYEDAVALADKPAGRVLTVTFRIPSDKIAGAKVEGTLTPGHSVTVTDGAVFSVSDTSGA